MSDWSRKTWFVTGASTGFGRTFVEEILERGGKAVATARDPGSLQDLVERYPGRVLTCRLDVTDPGEVREAMAAAEAFGGFDVLVNNAGYGFLGGVEESTDEEIEAQFAVNFFGALRMIRAALPAMRARGAGYIVNLSSIAGIVCYPGAGFYSASKFALEALSEGLAGEVAPFGIRVLIVEPGYFRTDFAGRSIRTTSNDHPAYPALAEQRRRVRQVDGQQPGDPRRGIAAILTAMNSDTPPLRLPLGPDGYDVASQAYEKKLVEARAWAEVSSATSFG